MKIKIGNIPSDTIGRKCVSIYRRCSECPFTVICDTKECGEDEIIELSEKDFPTNREWVFNDFIDAEISKIMNHHRHNNTYCSIYRIVKTLSSKADSFEDWLYQPCRYLMEEE